ncbi:hypothetical protein, partial [Paraburkholderia ribeironis]|uniref:hypothetical protein n=1 Tax=Paraburkholderia ribeironis TaxID=1247936 RepID=UPI001C3F7A6F
VSSLKSAHHGRFFFFVAPCIVEENFTGDLPEIAAPALTSSCPASVKALISLSKRLWHSPC